MNNDPTITATARALIEAEINDAKLIFQSEIAVGCEEYVEAGERADRAHAALDALVAVAEAAEALYDAIGPGSTTVGERAGELAEALARLAIK